MAKDCAGVIRLRGVEGILVERANGCNADVARPGFTGELFRIHLPIFLVRPALSVGKAHPRDGAEAVLLCPIKHVHEGVGQESNTHGDLVEFLSEREASYLEAPSAARAPSSRETSN